MFTPLSIQFPKLLEYFQVDLILPGDHIIQLP